MILKCTLSLGASMEVSIMIGAILGLTLVSFSIAGVVFITRTIFARRAFHETRGVVTKSQLQTAYVRRTSWGPSKPSVLYCVEYSYDVDGIRHLGRASVAAEQTNVMYREGQSIAVYFSPKRHEKSMIQLDVHRGFLVAFGLFFTIPAALLCFEYAYTAWLNLPK